MDIENSGRAPKHWGVVLMVLVILTPLILGMGIWYTVMQRNKAALKLTPEDAIQAFREAGFTIEDVQDVTYYPGPLPPGIYGRKLNLIIGSDTYSIHVILYSDSKRSRKMAKEVNAFNDSMSGGYASAFSYGAMLVQVYPSDETLTNRLHSILKKID
jgi:hypothetical protein